MGGLEHTVRQPQPRCAAWMGLVYTADLIVLFVRSHQTCTKLWARVLLVPATTYCAAARGHAAGSARQARQLSRVRIARLILLKSRFRELLFGADPVRSSLPAEPVRCASTFLQLYKLRYCKSAA